MLSMFIIMRIIICIIKTTYFENTNLMAELEGKLPQSKWSLFAHNFSSSGYFYKIFDMYLQKGLVYFERFSLQLLFFWSYNPSLNGQIFFLIDTQAHL